MRNGTTRRRLLFGIPLLFASGLPGCKSISTASAVEVAGRGIGVAAGVLLSRLDLDPDVRRALRVVVETVLKVVPGAGEDLVTTWGAAAQEHINNRIAEGKLTPFGGAVALAAFVVVIHAYVLLEHRHPEIRTVRSLACAAIDGFTAGFLTVFAPTELDLKPLDAEAYDELKRDPAVLALENLLGAGRWHKLSTGGCNG